MKKPDPPTKNAQSENTQPQKTVSQNTQSQNTSSNLIDSLFIFKLTDDAFSTISASLLSAFDISFLEADLVPCIYLAFVF